MIQEFVLPLFLVLCCLLALSWFAGSDAPYIPTQMELIEKTLAKAKVKKGKKFYELGSGDGRVVYVAARMGAQATGIEQSLLRVIYSKYKAKKLRLTKAAFIHGNIFSRKYTDADVVYIFLLKPAVVRLENKLYAELKKGAIIITQRYHFQSWQPFAKIGEFNLYQV